MKEKDLTKIDAQTERPGGHSLSKGLRFQIKGKQKEVKRG